MEHLRPGGDSENTNEMISFRHLCHYAGKWLSRSQSGKRAKPLPDRTEAGRISNSPIFARTGGQERANGCCLPRGRHDKSEGAKNGPAVGQIFMKQ